MTARAILLDIEGTTSSIEYVYDVLFPYVRQESRPFLEAHWNDADVRKTCQHIAQESGRPDSCRTLDTLLEVIFSLMDADVKSTGLKELQGLISREGYKSGKLRAHFYPDVPPALERWTKAGVTCAVYSSGSIEAQKNFYRYADAGDLSRFISANFDTTTGLKREQASFEKIASALKTPPGAILFCSDVVAELDAAKAAGMQTVLVVRPGNKAVVEGHGHRTVSTFDEIS